MRTPRERNDAFIMTKHEVFWEKRDYMHGSQSAARLRHVSAYVLKDVVRWKHDLLNVRVNPLRPPMDVICDIAYEAALEEPAGPQLERLGSIAVNLAGISEGEPSYRRADQLLEVSMHLLAQKAILEA